MLGSCDRQSTLPSHGVMLTRYISTLLLLGHAMCPLSGLLSKKFQGIPQLDCPWKMKVIGPGSRPSARCMRCLCVV